MLCKVIVSDNLSLTCYCITSDGGKHGNPKYYRKYEQKLAKKQRQLAKKQKGSNNHHKARKAVAKVHEKITRCREDFSHKLSRKIVDENQVLSRFQRLQRIANYDFTLLTLSTMYPMGA